jgi:hypothetical protein
MSYDPIAQATRLAVHALERARATADRRQKKLWHEIADAWAARVAALKADAHLVAASTPPPSGKRSPPRRH